MWEHDCGIEKKNYSSAASGWISTTNWPKLSDKSNSKLLWLRLHFTSLCDWSRKITPRSRPIRRSRASGSLPVFIMRSHWLLIVYSLHLIGHWDYSAFGLTTLNREALYHFHFWGWLPLRLSKGTIIMPTNLQNDTPDYNTTNLSCGESCWFK